MAGAGSRFEKDGYLKPKPLIDINGKTMIETVVENLPKSMMYFYIVQKKHAEKYHLDVLLKSITPNCEIIEVDGLTEGATSSVLMAKKFIDNHDSLIIMNSDNLIIFDYDDFIKKSEKYDGSIISFIGDGDKWSYVKVNNSNLITEVAEKKVISKFATAGLYFWKQGSDFVKYSEKMIQKNIRTNGEFYVCPVYNEAIIDDRKIFNYLIDKNKMWGLGTPEDLNYFIKNYSK